MADRIDHAAEAMGLLARAEKQGSDALGDTLRLDAFVHSTLAVAEQQRIANLIALATLQQMPAPHRYEAWFALHDNPQTEYGDYTLKPSIADGLGL